MTMGRAFPDRAAFLLVLGLCALCGALGHFQLARPLINDEAVKLLSA